MRWTISPLPARTRLSSPVFSMKNSISTTVATMGTTGDTNRSNFINRTSSTTKAKLSSISKIVAIAGCIIICIAVLIFIFVVYYFKIEPKAVEPQVGIPLVGYTSDIVIGQQVTERRDIAQVINYFANRGKLIPYETIETGDLIGDGNFGQVYRGKLKIDVRNESTFMVVVKKLKQTCKFH